MFEMSIYTVCFTVTTKIVLIGNSEVEKGAMPTACKISLHSIQIKARGVLDIQPEIPQLLHSKAFDDAIF